MKILKTYSQHEFSHKMKCVYFLGFFVFQFIFAAIAATPTSNQSETTKENLNSSTTKATTEIKTNNDITESSDKTANTEDNQNKKQANEVIKIDKVPNGNETRRSNDKEEPNIIIRIYYSVRDTIIKIINSERVHRVIKNIGTCAVNGVMEIISYYVPAPFIPLIASAAGIVIPFEPVVTLRHVMPVTSYRRALNSAVNTFMGTFDKYKVQEEDPYMTRRFNRRFMNADGNKENGDQRENKDA